jgi:hypothetical protein
MVRRRPSDEIAEGDVVLIRARVRAVYTDSITVRILNVQGVGFTQLGVAPNAIAGLAPSDLDVPPMSWR